MSGANSVHSGEDDVSLEEWDLCETTLESDITGSRAPLCSDDGDPSGPESSSGSSTSEGGDASDSDSEGDRIIDEILRQNCGERRLEMDGFMVFMEEVDRNIAEIQGVVVQCVDSLLVAVNQLKSWAFG